MTHNISLHTDILSMNVSWLLEDLELFENQFNILESIVFTIAICITFFMAIIVHRSFYRLIKRLPGRDINQIIYPYMVKYRKPKTLLMQETDISHQLLFQVFLSLCMGSYSIYTILDFWVYPLNNFVGDIGCYMLVYARNIGLGIIQVHSFYVVLFRYICLFHLNLLQRFSISSKVSMQSIACEPDSLKTFVSFQVFARIMAMSNFLFPILTILTIITDKSTLLYKCLGKGYINFLSTKVQLCSSGNVFQDLFCWVWTSLIMIVLSDIIDVYCMYCCLKEIKTSTEESKKMLSKQGYANRRRQEF